LGGYYAHITALDDMVGKLIHTLRNGDNAENTIIVLYFSDHWFDLLVRMGPIKKQQPYNESIRDTICFFTFQKILTLQREKGGPFKIQKILYAYL